LTGHLERAFAKRLGELPPNTQTLLALAAAEPTGDTALLWSAALELGLDWSAAAPAERARLIEFAPRVRFRTERHLFGSVSTCIGHWPT
jgi:hypothetical protein